MTNPVLRTKAWVDGQMRVEGGLRYIKGNSAPYFSLTALTWRNGREDSGGCLHDLILGFYPELADLVALHLSDINGRPMHAAANGWYQLAGFFDGAGEQYHGGNSERRFPCAAPADKPWQTTESRKPTKEECLQIWADHCRITIEQAREAALIIAAKWNYPDMKAAHAEFIELQSDRWAQEAKACVAKHKLVVYGDQWKHDKVAS